MTIAVKIEKGVHEKIKIISCQLNSLIHWTMEDIKRSKDKLRTLRKLTNNIEEMVIIKDE